jgi:threonine dehydrogenase-like Zn-dependent dehydrogenase
MSLAEVPTPRPDANEVLLRVGLAGICGSDIARFTGRAASIPPPILLGHEFWGWIEDVGAGVTGLPSGGRVVVYPLLTDGTCDQCVSGNSNRCRERRLIGAHRPGGFAEFVAVPATACIPIMPAVDDVSAALIEPLACGARAVGFVESGARRALILGAGQIGLVSVALLARLGTSLIAVSEPHADRRRAAERWGAHATFDPTDGDLANWSKEMTGGLGWDVVIDAVGQAATRRISVQTVRPGGLVTFVGTHDDDSDLPGRKIVLDEVRIFGSFGYTAGDFDAAVQLATEGAIPITPADYQIVPLSDGEDAFRQLAGPHPPAAKVLLRGSAAT